MTEGWQAASFRSYTKKLKQVGSSGAQVDPVLQAAPTPPGSWGPSRRLCPKLGAEDPRVLPLHTRGVPVAGHCPHLQPAGYRVTERTLVSVGAAAGDARAGDQA